MPPFQNFTTKAKEAVRKAHELAIERGQSHVSTVHLLAALIMQDESPVISILEKLDIDIVTFTELLLESLETPETRQNVSQSYQLYLLLNLRKHSKRLERLAHLLVIHTSVLNIFSLRHSNIQDLRLKY